MREGVAHGARRGDGIAEGVIGVRRDLRSRLVHIGHDVAEVVVAVGDDLPARVVGEGVVVAADGASEEVVLVLEAGHGGGSEEVGAGEDAVMSRSIDIFESSNKFSIGCTPTSVSSQKTRIMRSFLSGTGRKT